MKGEMNLNQLKWAKWTKMKLNKSKWKKNAMKLYACEMGNWIV